jgi:hypothetical protein
MRLPDLESLVLDELHRARLRLKYEIRRSPTGVFILLWSDVERCEGFGGRIVVAHVEGLRKRQNSIAVLALHSRVPKLVYDTASVVIPGVDQPRTLHLPTRCPPPILRALVCHAIGETLPTKLRRRDARRRLREAGVRLKDFEAGPTTTRRRA